MSAAEKPGRSLRPAVELAAVAGLVTADLWLVWDRPWLSALARAMAAAVLIVSLLRRAAGRRLQPTAMTAARAWLEAAAATLALGVAVVAWAAAVRGPLDEPDLSLLALPAPALGLWLLRRLALVSVQQLALQLCLWPLAREVLGSGARATLLVAVLFGLGHLPSPAFAAATAIGAALWIGLYRRSRRLAPLIASHALLAGLASTLPDRLFYDMKVGAPALEIAAAQQSLAGEDRRSLLAAFGSPRYGAYRGGTDEGYVAGLYRDVLGRIATEEEVRDGVEQLATTTRLGLAKRMLLAPELDEATLWRRIIDDQPLAPGIDVAPASADVVFAGWYPAEGEWRWARDPAPAIGFRIDREPGRGHVLALSGGAAAHAVPEARQRPVSVELELNGRLVGSCRFTDFTPRDYRFVLDPEHLAADGDNLLRFLVAREAREGAVAGPPTALEGDSRDLGFGLRALRVAPLRYPSTGVLHADDDYFLAGFSIGEKRLRWTRDPSARLVYPLPAAVPGGCYELRLEAGAFERQDVDLAINGYHIARWTFDGLTPQKRSVSLDAGLMRPGSNLVDFHLPGARSPEGDPRRLGLALIALRIIPLRDCA